MFVTKEKFNKVIGVFLDAIEDLENKFDNKIALMELNQEAELYELRFIKDYDMYKVLKEGKFFTAFHTLEELRVWFAGYKEGIDDIVITVNDGFELHCDNYCDACCDDFIDNGCVDPIQDEPKKSLSSKKKK